MSDELVEIQSAFDQGYEDDKEEDAIKLDMIGAGATFKNVTRLFNQFMIDAGHAISKADKDAIVEETLLDADLSDEEAFMQAVDALVENLDGSTQRSAMSLVRSYAKKNEMEIWTKPKGEVGSRPSFVRSYHNWIVANLDATEADAIAYVNGEGDYADTTDNVKRHLSHYLTSFRLAARACEKARELHAVA